MVAQSLLFMHRERTEYLSTCLSRWGYDLQLLVCVSVKGKVNGLYYNSNENIFCSIYESALQYSHT